MSESFEKNKDLTPPADDFLNIDTVNEVMTGQDEERLTALRNFLLEHGMSERQIDLSIAAQKMRRDVHAAQDRELEQRRETNPAPTAEEISAGAYVEALEPQVRHAIFKMRHKGYNTASSGFNEFNLQSTSFNERALRNLPERVRSQLAELGVRVKDDNLSFACEEIDLEKMKKHWDAIAEILPDLGHPASPSVIPMAKLFRERTGQLSEAERAQSVSKERGNLE